MPSQSIGSPPWRTEALQAAGRASARAAAVMDLEMSRGLSSLASITSTAPWVGLAGTLLGMNDSFGAVGASKESIMAGIFEGFSRALLPCAFGIAVALAAMWAYQYLLAELRAMELEMKNAILQMLNDLSRL